MEEPQNRYNMDWSREKNYPRPDYLSSSRKRLVPQLLYKRGILKTWRKKQAVALHKGFYNILPTLPEVGEQEAEIAWLIYDMERDSVSNRYHLKRFQTVYTLFQPALDKIATSEVGPIEDFLDSLQEKLDNKRETPDAPTFHDLL